MKKVILIAMCLLWQTLHAEINFIPKPQSVEYGKGKFLIENGITIYAPESGNFNTIYLQDRLDRVFDFHVEKTEKKPYKNYILFEKTEGLGKEEYLLSVDREGIKITSSFGEGEFYAIQTLLQMLPAAVYADKKGPDGMLLKELEIPFIKISDKPRFSYRGSMLDVSRTFFSKEYVKRHLEWLAYHKINKFHFHLTDDNGWRIEIKKYPELTRKGAWRGEKEALVPSFGSGNQRYGGYYTREDIKEIVSFAKERNIEVIPEIDLPGHSKAVAVSYPDILCSTDKNIESVQLESGNVWCAASEKNYKMLDGIIKEVAALFESEYIHIGGDEVALANWKECPQCQALMKKEGIKEEKDLLNYFVNRVDKIIKKYGKKMAGWDEIIETGSLSEDARVYAWRNADFGLRAIKRGQPTIIQIGKYCYLDMKYSILERGHTWAGIVSMEKAYSLNPDIFEIKDSLYNLTAEEKKNVVGVQGGLWTELMIYPPHFSEYQMFPRLCVMAEVGWTDQDKREYKDFYQRLTSSHFERMYYMGIKFRIPYPDVSLQWNKVLVKSPYPSAVIRYTFDGTDPSLNSPVYSSEILTDSPENLRFATFFCDIKSATVKVPCTEKFLSPVVKVSASENLGEHPKATLKMLEDYDFGTYFRSANPVKEGDFVLFEFENPLSCNTVEVISSVPVIDFYGIADGHVEYSYDGKVFIKGDKFRYGKAVISTHNSPLSAVKIVFDGIGESKTIAIQDLRIK